MASRLLEPQEETTKVITVKGREFASMAEVRRAGLGDPSEVEPLEGIDPKVPTEKDEEKDDLDDLPEGEDDEDEDDDDSEEGEGDEDED
jgi:hypothetical protein